eukprot:scaffold41244_cov62-Phaeocystis_antarctica.AAC.3
MVRVQACGCWHGVNALKGVAVSEPRLGEAEAEAARLRGCEAARLRGCEAARLRGCEAARLRGCEVARLRGCEAARLRRRCCAKTILATIRSAQHRRREVGGSRQQAGGRAGQTGPARRAGAAKEPHQLVRLL